MSGTATIGTVRLRRPVRPDVVQRLQLESRLERAELQPRSLPPSSVLIVRSVSSRAGSDGRNDWSEVRRQLDELHRNAVRPRHSRDPSAPAVVFQSEAELAACFATDVIDHVAAERWWWRHAGFSRSLSPANQLATYLVERPRSVPAALMLLAQDGLLLAVAKLFTPAQSMSLLHAVSRSFELEIPSTTAVTIDAPSPPLLDARPGDPAPAWREWVPAAAGIETLPPETCLLLATALGLVVAPRVVRSARFAREATEWLALKPQPARPRTSATAERDLALPHAQPETVATMPDGPHGMDRAIPGHAPVARGETAASAHLPRLARSKRVEHASSQDDRAGEVPVVAQESGSAPRIVPDRDSPRRANELPDPPRAEHRDGGHAPGLGREQPPTDPAGAPLDNLPMIVSGLFALPALPALDAAGVQTSLAGALFLINPMLQLDHPRRSGRKNELIEALGAWGTLEAIALGIMDSLPESASSWAAWSSDHVWAALATLEGRGQTQRLGHTLPRATALEPLAAWSHGTASAPAYRVGRYVARRVDPIVRRWLASVVPFLRDHLASALGTDPDSAIRLVVLREGRLYVTGTHVDVVMALDEVSGQVRKAGLDIDPGWQPRYGRVIKFHYR